MTNALCYAARRSRRTAGARAGAQIEGGGTGSVPRAGAVSGERRATTLSRSPKLPCVMSMTRSTSSRMRCCSSHAATQRGRAPSGRRFSTGSSTIGSAICQRRRTVRSTRDRLAACAAARGRGVAGCDRDRRQRRAGSGRTAAGRRDVARARSLRSALCHRGNSRPSCCATSKASMLLRPPPQWVARRAVSRHIISARCRHCASGSENSGHEASKTATPKLWSSAPGSCSNRARSASTVGCARG